MTNIINHQVCLLVVDPVNYLRIRDSMSKVKLVYNIIIETGIIVC